MNALSNSEITCSQSSLTLSLLRCIYTDGNVYYDGIPTSSLNLDSLRSNITIIPQVVGVYLRLAFCSSHPRVDYQPELLSGSLRQNLDPFDQYEDALLNDALHAAGLFSLQSETDEDRIVLDSTISGGGSNLSVGQRQILALARAIVRGSKLLILDEGLSVQSLYVEQFLNVYYSNFCYRYSPLCDKDNNMLMWHIDYETDSIIQSSLRNELGGDVTLITVAHRLQTIMDSDKIVSHS